MMSVNQTTIMEFILLGFGEFQVLFFLIFLIIYAVTITGNLIIVVLVVTNQNLHTPMYFFLGNLSFLETCYVSNIFPQVLSGIATGNRRISFSRCITQWYLFASLDATECCLLCVMSYDRYIAICRPLHYIILMKTQTCFQLAASSWINGIVLVSIPLSLMLRLTFCGNLEIDHYFCDYFPLLKLSCSDTSVLETTSFVLTAVFTLPPFLLTLISYAYIIVTVLKIPSSTGRQKAFSTCSSHLAVVSIFYGSLMIVYMLPKNEMTMQKFLSFLYTALPPLANPFIYSLKNKEIKDALRSNIDRLLQYSVPQRLPVDNSNIYL